MNKNIYLKNNAGKMAAFTLVEISIVIIIIGLIIAGISAGQGIVSGAKLQSVMTDVTKYRTAYNTFRLQYNAIPGDMLNAYQYWGATTGSCTNNYINTNSTGCNGNGDGNLGPTNSNKETTMMWKHLYLAGLIESKYSGTQSGSIVAGRDVPRTAINNTALYTTFDTFSIAGNKTRDMMCLDIATNVASGTSILTPKDAYFMDNKLDDGNPNKGNTFAHNGNGGTGNCVTSGNYDISNSSIRCRIVFLLN